MKFDQLYIAGIDSFLPPPVSVRDAVADGRYDARQAEETELESVLVAEREAPPEMAVHAARGAIARAGIDPAEIALILHTSIMFQGLEFYPTASYIHRALNNHSALTLETKGMSNGGMLSFELAASYLAASADRRAALITSADKYAPPLFDRWRSDTGMVMGDGAAALVLSKQRGFARVLSIVTTSDPSIEGLHRGRAPFTAGPLMVDAHQRKRDYLAEVGLPDMQRRFRAALRAAAERALGESNTQIAEVARFAIPHLGRILLVDDYYVNLQIDEALTTWQFGRRTGHVGAGDQFLGLGWLMDSGALVPGDRCMMIGVGAGFTFSCAVIEIVERVPLRPSPLFS